MKGNMGHDGRLIDIRGNISNKSHLIASPTPDLSTVGRSERLSPGNRAGFLGRQTLSQSLN